MRRASALLLALLSSTPFADAAADTPASGGDSGADTNAPSGQTVQLGDLKFTIGPQSSGDFGATLKGGVADKLRSLHDSGCYAGNAPDYMSCHDLYLVLNASVDAAWSSAGNGNAQNKNNAAVVVNPAIYYQFGSRHFEALPETEIEKHVQDCIKATAGLSGDALKKAREEHAADCFFQRKKPAWSDYLVAAWYPDIEYRYGTFEQTGGTYTANQLLLGTGAQLLYPARIGTFFTNWPYISVGYNVAKNYGASNLPVSSSFRDHYLVVDGRLEFYIPGFRQLTGLNGIALIDLTESKQTQGASGAPAGWQTARMVQLIVDTSGGLKPALTYRSGINQGMVYDRQVIFGVLWNIFENARGGK